MGGDHKCPVCEATFTRPQHVARHMRSHTGDRPYKCQYCGDQFARSDLLSRHVNKCHANEKPLPSTGIRRKGSASASRATTSKQVCDQCVQSNTSCDGCNPCAKCVQRKFRCTFVKFHRQTAPVGPGHNIHHESSSGPPSPNLKNATTTTSSPSSRVSLYHNQQPEDDFVLGPPPTVVPTMAEALYGATPFTFPPLYPTNEMSGDNTDYVGKYRPHPDFFGPTRSGISSTTSSGMSGTGLSPNLYDPRPPPSWLAWGQQNASDAAYHQRHADLISDSAHPPPLPSSLPSLPPHVPPSMNDKDMQAELANHHQQLQQENQHRRSNYMNLSIPYPVSDYLLSDPNTNAMGGGESTEIFDFHGSDTASNASHSSCSVPSSAASSSVHLPLATVGVGPGPVVETRRSLLGGGYDNNGAPSSSPTSSPSHRHHRHHHHPGHRQHQPGFQSKQVAFSTTHDFSSNQHHHQEQQHPHSHTQQQTLPVEDNNNLNRPEFSSAFGLLSLDDPNVTAGISTDGIPFFDDPSQAHNQPMGLTTASGATTTTTVDSDHLGHDGANIDTPMPLKRGSGGRGGLLSLEGSSDNSSRRRFPLMTATGAPAVESPSTTPSRDADAKELKEFWKQYMRIPLSGSGFLSFSGSGGGGSGEVVTPSGNGNKATNASGSGYRRPRVASLPAAKTPIMERDRDDLNLGYSNTIYQNQPPPPSSSSSNLTASNMNVGATAAAPTSVRRTSREVAGMAAAGMSMRDMEDLRSYEAAVMARKAPTTLNLKVRRPVRIGRGGGKARGRAGGKMREEGSPSASSGNSPLLPHSGGGDTAALSACSSSSSLANVFGGSQRRSGDHHQALFPTSARIPFVGHGRGGNRTSSRMMVGRIKKEESSSPSLSSPASSSFADLEGDAGGFELGTGAEVEDGGTGTSPAGRPSFKRLPSQTLGRDNPKRPFYGFGGEGEEEGDLEDRIGSGGWGCGVYDGDEDNGDSGSIGGGKLVGVGGSGIAERRRRMSEPSNLTGIGVGVDGLDLGVVLSAVQSVDDPMGF